MTLAPNLYLVRAPAVDRVAASIEEELAEDGLSLLGDGEPAVAGARGFRLAQVTDDWVAVWDELAAPQGGWPDGDPATALARGLSAYADTDVLYIWSQAGLWGYLLYHLGLEVDRFAADSHRLAAEVPIEGDDTAAAWRGDLDLLRPYLVEGRTDEELASALCTGDDALQDFLDLIGVPRSLALSLSDLSPAERDLTLELRFAAR